MSDGAAADQRSRVGINAPATSTMAQADAWSGYYVIVNKARTAAFFNAHSSKYAHAHRSLR